MKPKVYELLALSSGTGKSGNYWARGLIRGHMDNGQPIVKEFFLPPEVGKKLQEQGYIEDVPVYITCGLDQFLRPCILDVVPAENEEGLI